METESPIIQEIRAEPKVSTSYAWRWPALLFLLRCALGLIFAYAGIIKVGDPTAFTGELRGYRILPDDLLTSFAVYLPVLEILIGAGLVFRLVYPGALLLSGAMLGVFVIALASALWRGLDISCGCFGHSSKHESLAIALVRDAALLGIWFLLVRQLWNAEAARRGPKS